VQVTVYNTQTSPQNESDTQAELLKSSTRKNGMLSKIVTIIQAHTAQQVNEHYIGKTDKSTEMLRHYKGHHMNTFKNIFLRHRLQRQI